MDLVDIIIILIVIFLFSMIISLNTLERKKFENFQNSIQSNVFGYINTFLNKYNMQLKYKSKSENQNDKIDETFNDINYEHNEIINKFIVEPEYRIYEEIIKENKTEIKDNNTPIISNTKENVKYPDYDDILKYQSTIQPSITTKSEFNNTDNIQKCNNSISDRKNKIFGKIYQNKKAIDPIKESFIESSKLFDENYADNMYGDIGTNELSPRDTFGLLNNDEINNPEWDPNTWYKNYQTIVKTYLEDPKTRGYNISTYNNYGNIYDIGNIDLKKNTEPKGIDYIFKDSIIYNR
jgi:hypothetical protein